MFIGRHRELRDLQEGQESPGSELCVLYGRRRIGKSTLLEEFVRDKPAFFYLAGREPKSRQLARFVRELGDAIDDPLTGRVRVSSWDRHAGLCFEQFVKDHASLVATALGHELRETGTFWQRPTKRKAGVQIDAMIGCTDGVTLVCECKWSRTRIGTNAVDQLRERATLYPNTRGETLRLVLVAANGVTKGVLRQGDICVVTLDDLFVDL